MRSSRAWRSILLDVRSGRSLHRHTGSYACFFLHSSLGDGSFAKVALKTMIRKCLFMFEGVLVELVFDLLRV